MFVQAITSLHLSRPNLRIVLGAIVVASLSALVGCDSNDTSDPPEVEIAQVAISPDSATIEVGEQAEFSALAVSAAGDTIAIPEGRLEWEWISSDPDVFTVDENGTASGQSPGEEYCIIDATLVEGLSGSAEATVDLRAASGFVGRDSAFVLVF